MKFHDQILSTPFHLTNMDNFVKIINEESSRLVNYLKKNPCKDTMNEMKKVSLAFFCKFLFEYDISDVVDETVQLVNDITSGLVTKAFSVFLISPFLYQFTSMASRERFFLKELMKFKNQMLNAKTDASRESLKTKLETRKNGLNSEPTNLTLIEILLKNFKNTINEKTDAWSGFEMDEIRSQLGMISILDHLYLLEF